MLHFVYAGDPSDGRIQSPYSITKNLFQFFTTKCGPIQYHQWDSRYVPELTANDIVIGHPHYDHGTIVQQIFRRQLPCKAKCTIHPLHLNRVEDNMPFDQLSKDADRVFSIAGPYWYDSLDDSPFAHWKPKITRLDMAVDSNHFPFLRRKFNPIGKRKLVYIGSSMPQKNLGFLVRLMSAIPDVKLKWYGGSSDHPLYNLKNVEVVGWMHLDRSVAQEIIDNHDIIISVSHSDANPTTLLEGCAWGLIPICTKESGYYADERNDWMFDEIRLDSLDQSVANIRKLLVTPEDQLLERANRTRTLIETKYSWDRFCDTLWRDLEPLL